MHAYSQPPLVLVIDDDAEILDEVLAALREAGFRCQGFTSGDAAEEFARNLTPDLILSDVNLAGESGPEVCERMKRRAALPDVPVMFLSATQAPDIIRRHGPAGAAYHLRKPVEPALLVELMDYALWSPRAAAAAEPVASL